MGRKTSDTRSKARPIAGPQRASRREAEKVLEDLLIRPAVEEAERSGERQQHENSQGLKEGQSKTEIVAKAEKPKDSVGSSDATPKLEWEAFPPRGKSAAGPASPELDLTREAVSTGAESDLGKLLVQFRREVLPHKEALRAAFNRQLATLKGFKGTVEENQKLAQDMSKEAAECGLRLALVKDGQLISVSIKFHSGVFSLNKDGGGYVTSSATWPELTTVPRESKSGKRRPTERNPDGK